MNLTSVFQCAAAIALLSSAAASDEPARLVPFRFLLGTWEAVEGVAPGAGVGRAVFSRSLQDRVILRTSDAEYPAQGGRPAFRHDDLMVMYVDADSSVRADYYDNEGHVIRYAVQSPAIGQAVFVSAASPAVPRYRLTYKLAADGTLGGEFEIAPPGKPDSFISYLRWITRKVEGERAKQIP